MASEKITAMIEEVKTLTVLEPGSRCFYHHDCFICRWTEPW